MMHTAEETKTMKSLIAAHEAAVEKNGACSDFYSAETQKAFADMWAYAEAHEFVSENGTISVEV